MENTEIPHLTRQLTMGKWFEKESKICKNTLQLIAIHGDTYYYTLNVKHRQFHIIYNGKFTVYELEEGKWSTTPYELSITGQDSNNTYFKFVANDGIHTGTLEDRTITLSNTDWTL